MRSDSLLVQQVWRGTPCRLSALLTERVSVQPGVKLMVACESKKVIQHRLLELVVPIFNLVEGVSALGSKMDRERMGLRGLQVSHRDRRDARRVRLGLVVKKLARAVNDERIFWLLEQIIQLRFRPVSAVVQQLWALRKGVFGTLYKSRTWTSFLRNLHASRLRKDVRGPGNSQKSRPWECRGPAKVSRPTLATKSAMDKGFGGQCSRYSLCYKCADSVLRVICNEPRSSLKFNATPRFQPVHGIFGAASEFGQQSTLRG